MKNFLTRKQQCYKVGNAPPAEPEAYYECMEKIEQEMVTNSQRLLGMINALDEEDRLCKDTCRRTFEIDDKYNNCVQKCVKKFGEGLMGTYAKHYDEVLKDDAEYKKLKK